MTILDVKRKRDIRRQRGQFIAVAVTIGLGVMLFASTYDAYRNLESSYNFTYDRLNFADITVVGGDEGFVDEATEIEGVETTESRLNPQTIVKIMWDESRVERKSFATLAEALEFAQSLCETDDDEIATV